MTIPSTIRLACSRAALGLSWLALPADADVAALRDALHPRPVAVLLPIRAQVNPASSERKNPPWFSCDVTSA